jgi:adenylate cyclase
MAGRDRFSALMAPAGLQSVIGCKLFTLWRGRAVASVVLAMLLLFPMIHGENSTAGFSTVLWDTFHRLQPRVPESFPVVIVDIDRAALNRIGQWPWPRWRLAQLIDKISEKGASAIGIDIMMPEADRLSPEMLAKYPAIDQKTREYLLLLEPNDQRLAASMERNRVVIGRAGDKNSQSELKLNFLFTPVQIDGPAPEAFLNSYPGMVLNLRVLENAAFGYSLFNATPDSDGVVRKMPLISRPAANPGWQP